MKRRTRSSSAPPAPGSTPRTVEKSDESSALVPPASTWLPYGVPTDDPLGRAVGVSEIESAWLLLKQIADRGLVPLKLLRAEDGSRMGAMPLLTPEEIQARRLGEARI